MKTFALLLALLIPSLTVGQGDEPPESRLEALERACDEAASQSEMNQASYALAQYWDEVLTKNEAEAQKDTDVFDEERVALWAESSRAWRAYRKAQVALEADMARGGSIAPLYANVAFTRITKARIVELTEMLEEG